MAVRRYHLLAVWLISTGFGAGACRSTTLCKQASCDESAEPGSGNAGNATSPGMAGEPAEGGAGDQGPGAGAGGQDAGAGGAGAPAGLICPDGRADCDGSALTGCETSPEWNNRHCGVCGKRCEGGCSGGSCLPALRIADIQPTGMVSTATFAFVLTGGDQFMKIDLEDGAIHELSRVGGFTKLSLGSDRVYVWDPDHEGGDSGLYSMALAGSELESEPVQGADSFGASDEGAYYVQVEEDPETVDDVQKLWFRPRADAAWELLNEGITTTELIASSYAGVIMRQYDAEGKAHLYLLDGRAIVDYGLQPDFFVEAAATESSVAVLTTDLQQSRLSWRFADGTSTSYAVGFHPGSQFRTLHVSLYDVAMSFVEDGQDYVQWFDDDGLVRGRIGVPRGSDLVFIDSTHIWHYHLVNEFTPRFVRSTWFPTNL